MNICTKGGSKKASKRQTGTDNQTPTGATVEKKKIQTRCRPQDTKNQRQQQQYAKTISDSPSTAAGQEDERTGGITRLGSASTWILPRIF